jgi:hypothetical protein
MDADRTVDTIVGPVTIEGDETMSMAERSAARAKRIVANRASSHREAFLWDLDFWLAQTPEQRLSALVAIRRDLAKMGRRKRGKT